MRNLLIRFFVIIIFLANVFFISSVSHARSMSFSHYYVNANINKDGSVDIQEWVTYNFSGKYNGVFQNISYEKASGITDLKVFRADSLSSSLDSLRPLVNTNSQKPETFFYTDQNDTIKITVYTPSENTEKTYVYKYKIHNVINKYTDTAQLYWKFISDDNLTPCSDLKINIAIPEGAKKEDLKIFAHGPLTGNSEIIDNKSVKLSLEYLPPNYFVEARLLFPPTLISNTYPAISRQALGSILQEEAEWAAQSNEIRQEARERAGSQEEGLWEKVSSLSIFSLINIIFFILLSIAALLIYLFYVRQPKPYIDYDYYRDLPGNYSPAEMSILMDGWVETRDIGATLLDLVRRKHLNIVREKVIIDRLIFDKEVDDYIIYRNEQGGLDRLRDHEKFIIDWFLNDLGDSTRADFLKIQQYLKDNISKARSFRNKLSEWKSIIRGEAIYNSKLIEKGLIYKLPSSLIVLGISAVILFSIFSFINIIPLTYIIFLLTKVQKTPYGIEQYYKWKSFKRYLKDFSMMDKAEVPSLVIWEHYLVYAISLGVAKEVIEKLKLVIPPEQFDNGNLTYLNSQSGLFIDNSFLSFQNFVNDINYSAIAGSQDSSASGGGGGFSGGGGGGGGGSSGGGF